MTFQENVAIHSNQISFEGKYGFLDENGEIKIVEYSANNSTGFQSDLELSQVNALTEAEVAPQQVKVVFHSFYKDTMLIKHLPYDEC